MIYVLDACAMIAFLDGERDSLDIATQWSLLFSFQFQAQ